MNENDEYAQRREILVERQLIGRGLREPALLRAFRDAPRERFAAAPERACEDVPIAAVDGAQLPSAWDQASALAALAIGEGDRVLLLGASPGYAGALLAALGAEVFAVERDPGRAAATGRRLLEAGYVVRLRVGEPGAGWPDQGPYDAVLVAAPLGEPTLALLRQLGERGRLVTEAAGRVVRYRRTGPSGWSREELGLARPALEPAFGAPVAPARRPPPREAPPADRAALERLRALARPLDVEALADELSVASVVMLGESTHGTSEFYRLRTKLTVALVARGFDLVALEADWPDAAVLDRRVRGLAPSEDPARAFTRFPEWMWRNEEVEELVSALAAHARTVADPARRVRVVGLDLFSLHRSVERVGAWLDAVDPGAAARARDRYGCLLAWEGTPAWRGGWRPDCSADARAVLAELLERAAPWAALDPEGYVDAVGNARAVVAAERYHRGVPLGGPTAWNTREAHLVEVLGAEMARRGPGCRAVVWAHNTHVGDARATEIGLAGQRSLGELARGRWGPRVRLVGLGTAGGDVAAATSWDAPMGVLRLGDPVPGSHDALCLATSPVPFAVALRPEPALEAWRPLRAVGVVVDPAASPDRHYVRASLARQFDAWLWLPRTHPVHPVQGRRSFGDPETWPSGF